MAAHFRKDANELTTAGQYDHNLTLGMLKIFLLAGGSGNEDYRFPLRCVKQKLEQALLDIGFKDKEAVNLHMQVNKLTYNNICANADKCLQDIVWKEGVVTFKTHLQLQGSTSCIWKLGNSYHNGCGT